MPNLTELLELYGLFIVFAIVLIEQAGLPIPAFPVLIVAGALGMNGDISWVACLAVAVGACLISDFSWFSAGRRYGKRILHLLCRISLSPDACVSQTEDRFLRFGPKSLVVSKFIPGFNVIAAPMSGALGVSAPRFIAFSITGSLLWSTTGIAIGALFHESVDDVLSVLASMGTTALAVLSGLLAMFVLYKYVERRRFQRHAQLDRISMGELVRLTEAGPAPLIIDARSATARRLEPGIPDAVIYDASASGSFLATLDRDRHIIVYCSCPNDVSAAQVASLLIARGFHRARPLRGGLEAWHAHLAGIDPGQPLEAT